MCCNYISHLFTNKINFYKTLSSHYFHLLSGFDGCVIAVVTRNAGTACIVTDFTESFMKRGTET